MRGRLIIDVKKLSHIFLKSENRNVGIEISSEIRGLKYILKGNHLVFTSVENGVFAINLDKIEDFADEIVEIATMYEEVSA